MRPIDADSLLKKRILLYDGTEAIAVEDVENAPTLDVSQAVHAHWIPCVDHYECSRCRGEKLACYPYCTCGAIMDEEDGEQND